MSINKSSILSDQPNKNKKILKSFNNTKNKAEMSVTQKINSSSEGVIPIEVVTIELFEDLAPAHVREIKSLINGGYYNDIIFHRVVDLGDGFVAQTGDLIRAGYSITGSINAEFSSYSYIRGTIGMARGSDPDSATTEFFITMDDIPRLDSQYTVFGKVINGMEFIDSIAKGSPPDSPDKIISFSMMVFKQLGTMNYSNLDDIIIATGANSTLRGLNGSDLFLISNLQEENTSISIIDNGGIIQIPDNTYIDNIIFTSNAIRLTFSENREVTINNADKYIYNLGGNITSGDEGEDLTFLEMAEIFGVNNVLSLDGQEVGLGDLYII